VADSGSDVGVVIPVHNGARWLTEAIESLQRQTLSSWTAIVVDDGSTDGSGALARAVALGDLRITVVEQTNLGTAAARLRGLAELPISAAYVAFLDADDRYEPQALALLRAALHPRSDAVGAYALARYVDAEGNVVLRGRHEAVQRDRRVLVGHRVVDGGLEADLGFASLVVNNVIWPAAVALLRTDRVRAVGGPDPSFRVQQDWELYVRLSRSGPFVGVDRTLVDYRRHDANATVTSLEHSYQQDRLWHKTWRSPENTSQQRRTVGRAWRWLQLRQVRAHARQVPTALHRREPAALLRAVTGMILCATSAFLPGPPAAHRRLSPLMHDLPYPRESWQSAP
jgi:glycosyltransferase involved in cell wall biosynthesis